MDTKRLTYFCTIVESGQISRAAKFLGVAQPALSARLNELEEELGVDLIVRKGSTWQVTEAGKVLYDLARQALNQITEIPMEVRNAADGVKGRISVGLSISFMSYFTEMVPRISSRFPMLQFRILVEDSATLEEQVESRNLDFAIVLLPTTKEIFEVQSLPMVHFGVVYPTGLIPSSPDGTFGLKVLQGIPLMLQRLWHGGKGIHDQLWRELRRQGITPNVLLDSPDISVILGSLDTGVRAAAILPMNLIPKSIRERFEVRDLEGILHGVKPGIINLPDRYLTTAAREVMREILHGRDQPHP